MRTTHIVALVILLGSLGVTLYSFSGALARHGSVKDALAHPGDTMQVPGKIARETVRYDAQRGELRFELIDMGDASQRLPVLYRQPKPDTFDTATSVEAIGVYRDGLFTARNLLLKCPSKYQDESAARSAAR
jgi:cytochrome c-type biogenesis protein CcmE